MSKTIDPQTLSDPVVMHYLMRFTDVKLSELRNLMRGDIWKRFSESAAVQRGVAQLLKEQPIYSDELFLQLWDDAFFDLPDLTRGCLKMRFAAVILDDDNNVVAKSANRRMTDQYGRDRFCSATDCIRFSLESRTDAAIGDCQHSILWAIAETLERHSVSELQNFRIYESGYIMSNFAPWVSKELMYTCLNCINQFATYGLSEIWAVKEHEDGIARWTALPLTEDFWDTGNHALKLHGLEGTSS